MLLLLLLRPRPPWNLVSSGNRIGNQALLNCLQKKLTLLPTCKFKLIKLILYFSSSPFVEPPFYFLMYLKDQPNQFVLRLLNRTCIAYNFRSRRCSQFLSNGNWNWQIWTSMDKDFFFLFAVYILVDPRQSESLWPASASWSRNWHKLWKTDASHYLSLCFWFTYLIVTLVPYVFSAQLNLARIASECNILCLQNIFIFLKKGLEG